MTTYSCAFAFAGASVLLIRKAKPEWQKGLLNGIGGKLESPESVMDCTIREFREETGLWELSFQPKIYHSMMWPEYKSHTDHPLVYFSAFVIPPQAAVEAIKNTADADEPCVLWPVAKIDTAPAMPNVPFLVAMAKCLVLCTPEERKLRQPYVFTEPTLRDCQMYGTWFLPE
jgi:8-oxo-dGTP pyrophosphatase MutT (NUDIX family)